MPRLEQWREKLVPSGVVIYGQVYEDEIGRFHDGQWIRTSPVQGYSVDGNRVMTLNTEYTLGEPAAPKETLTKASAGWDEGLIKLEG